ncbi:hypothetical protein [Eubacterium oxidoreducens]|uniref:Helix-turn-helix domain-containing protein n=1 Tax=Eubacterium oxidoreducens TaxID=1732 RepID=A0A1G6A1Q4_EUBOX|nr:hypothetical protein [Eubacterium oxidoreducens]SDB02418.1 hypothetical protein SAMN02910417_00165 [Eubacterium oxidoreducens]
MEYLTISEVAEKSGIIARRVVVLCKEGRIEGAIKKSRMWLIPDTANKPEDAKTFARSLKIHKILTTLHFFGIKS